MILMDGNFVKVFILSVKMEIVILAISQGSCEN